MQKLLVYLAAASENLDQEGATEALGRQVATALGLSQGRLPALHIVRAAHPHNAIRRGLPEVREVLALAPDAVLVRGMKGTPSARALAGLGIPVLTVDKLRSTALPASASWTNPTLDSEGLVNEIREKRKLTVLDRRLTPRTEDGAVLSLNPLGFALGGIGWFMWRTRAVNIPRPDDRGLAVICPPEDYVVAGAHVTPMMLVPDTSALPAFARAVVRSSVLWPSTRPHPEFVSGGRLYSSSEVCRAGERVWSLPVSLVTIGLRRAGVTEPVHFRTHQEVATELMNPQTALELALLNEHFGPFSFDVEGTEPEEYRPLCLRIECRDVEAGYLSSGIADWLGTWRGRGTAALEQTWIEGTGQVADFVLSEGYQPGPAPAGTPEVMLTPVPLFPMA